MDSELQHLFNQNKDQYAKIDKINERQADMRSAITKLESESVNIRDDFEAYKSTSRWVIGLMSSIIFGVLGIVLKLLL